MKFTLAIIALQLSFSAGATTWNCELSNKIQNQKAQSYPLKLDDSSAGGHSLSQVQGTPFVVGNALRKVDGVWIRSITAFTKRNVLNSPQLIMDHHICSAEVVENAKNRWIACSGMDKNREWIRLVCLHR